MNHYSLLIITFLCSLTVSNAQEFKQMIFMTSSAYNLNLNEFDGINWESGIAGADAICTSEANHPAKALLVDENGYNNGCSIGDDPKPCRRASITANEGDGQIDWPLIPNSILWSFDLSGGTEEQPLLEIGTINANGLIDYPLTNQVIADCFNQASGLNYGFQTIVGATCNSWSTSDPLVFRQGLGWSCAYDRHLVYGGGPAPCSSNRFLCVTVPPEPTFQPTSVPSYSFSCPTGTYLSTVWQDEVTKESCRSCSPGTYNDNDNHRDTRCSVCAGGSYSTVYASTCTTCPVGHYCPPGASTYFTCPDGMYATIGSEVCSACPVGTYSKAGAGSISQCLEIEECGGQEER